jgi:hypothetical protein
MMAADRRDEHLRGTDAPGVLSHGVAIGIEGAIDAGVERP